MRFGSVLILLTFSLSQAAPVPKDRASVSSLPAYFVLTGDSTTVVTIQFGHNDQKADKGISVAKYQTNLQNMVKDVISPGGTPIIVTPLTRRGFKSEVVNVNLAEHSKAAIAAANAAGVKYIDLNRASTDYINAISKTNAKAYDLKEGDSTHLNDAGRTVFGRMVADLLGRARSDLKTYLKDNKALSDKIWAGEFATCNEK